MTEATTDSELIMAEIRTALSPDTLEAVLRWQKDSEKLSKAISLCNEHGDFYDKEAQRLTGSRAASLYRARAEEARLLLMKIQGL